MTTQALVHTSPVLTAFPERIPAFWFGRPCRVAGFPRVPGGCQHVHARARG